MRMVVAENVTLTKPLTDGRDYTAGDIIELDAAVAADWKRRGWVVEVMPEEPMPLSPRPLLRPRGFRG
jgi:hypothetical protein